VRAQLAALDHYDCLTLLLLGALVAVVCASHGDYAISNDEVVQQRYGELIVAYYTSGFADRSLFDFGNLYLYGGLFDIVATLLGRALPFDLFQIRHVLSALTGVAGIAATAGTARLIAGPRAGFIAAVALSICGVWFGGMFNHTKDVPFAAAMMGAGYFLLRCARDLPKPRIGDVVGFGVLLGAALGLRAIGLLLLGYACLVVLMQAFLLEGQIPAARIRFVAQSAIRLVPAVAIGYVVMIAAWPWAALEPLNPLRAIWSFAHFHYEIRTVLAGTIYLMDTVPRWYVPAYLLIKLPLIVFAGALIALTAIAWPGLVGAHATRRRRAELAVVAFMAAFPIVCAVVAHGPAFTGMRHYLFVVPPLAVLAGAGFDALLISMERLGSAAVAAALATLGAGFLWNAGQLVQLHPHQYLFYNSIVGGLQGASRRYSTDYWVNIMPEAVNSLDAYVRKTDGRPRSGYTVGVCGERLSFERAAGSRFQWTRGWLEADFFIAPTHLDCDRVLQGKIAFTIERLGVVVGVVQDLRGLAPNARGFIEHRKSATEEAAATR
jgi:hypothetical protein